MLTAVALGAALLTGCVPLGDDFDHLTDYMLVNTCSAAIHATADVSDEPPTWKTERWDVVAADETALVGIGPAKRLDRPVRFWVVPADALDSDPVAWEVTIDVDALASDASGNPVFTTQTPADVCEQLRLPEVD